MIWNVMGRGKGPRTTQKDVGPYSNHRLAVRLEMTQHLGVFAQVATLLAEEGASLGAVDIVSATKSKVIRDITFDTANEDDILALTQKKAGLPPKDKRIFL